MMDTSETTRLRALLERAALPACEAGRDRGDNLCVYQTGRHQWTVAEVSESPDASDDAIEARAQLFAATPTALPGLLDAAERAERAERERDDLAATLETRTAEHALAMEQLAAVTAERDRLTLAGAAPGLITGIVRKILGAVDGEATPTAAERVVRERDVLRAQQAPLLDAHDALVAAARAAGWTGAGATGAELVAWVRRGEREACADAITARLAEAVREVRDKTYRGTGAERDTAAAVRDAIEAVRDMIREGGE